MKILVIRLGAMGDLIHASAAIAYVHKMRPNCDIDILTDALYADLATRFEGVYRVHTWDKQWNTLLATRRTLAEQRYDVVINLHPSLKTNLLMLLIDAGKYIVYRKEKITAKGNAQRNLDRRHAVRDFYEPFRKLLELPEENPPLVPQLRLNTQTQKPATPLIGLVPGVGAKRGNRAWLPQHYKTLISKTLAETPARFVILGGPDEALLGHQLVKIDPARIENACGLGSIVDTAMRLAQCHVVVGGDTGPLHMAAALGTPVISLFGPTNVKRTGPRGHSQRVTLTPPANLQCWPCELAACPLTGNDYLACMDRITPDAVYTALRNQLSEISGGNSGGPS